MEGMRRGLFTWTTGRSQPQYPTQYLFAWTPYTLLFSFPRARSDYQRHQNAPWEENQENICLRENKLKVLLDFIILFFSLKKFIYNTFKCMLKGFSLHLFHYQEAEFILGFISHLLSVSQIVQILCIVYWGLSILIFVFVSVLFLLNHFLSSFWLDSFNQVITKIF